MSKSTKSTNGSQAKQLKRNPVTASTIDNEINIGRNGGSAITSGRPQIQIDLHAFGREFVQLR